MMTARPPPSMLLLLDLFQSPKRIFYYVFIAVKRTLFSKKVKSKLSKQLSLTLDSNTALVVKGGNS